MNINELKINKKAQYLILLSFLGKIIVKDYPQTFFSNSTLKG